MVWMRLIVQILNIALIVFVFYMAAKNGLSHVIKEPLFFSAIILLPSLNLLVLYDSNTEPSKKYIARTLLAGTACCILILTYQFASQLQFKRNILPTAEGILAKDGKTIAELTGRPSRDVGSISFRVEDTEGHTRFDGDTLVINSSYIGKSLTNLERIIVWHLVGKTRDAPLPAAYHWLQEGHTHFINYKLGYKTLYPTYYPYVDSVYGAANFFNWLYERPDNKKTYYAVIKDINAGTKPHTIEALLEEYHDAQRKKAEQAMQAGKK